MTRRSVPVVLASAAALAGCGTTAAPQVSPSSDTRPPSGVAQRGDGGVSGDPAATATTVARSAAGHYDIETGGRRVRRLLRGVAGDPALTSALRRGDLAAARAEAERLEIGKAHISRIQVRRGRRLLVDVGVPFVVAGPSTTVHAGGTSSRWTVTIGIQDEVGVVRLVHRHHPVDVLIRGDGGQVRTSLPAAAGVTPPRRGPFTIAGRRYVARSFRRLAMDHEGVTVWVLAPA